MNTVSPDALFAFGLALGICLGFVFGFLRASHIIEKRYAKPERVFIPSISSHFGGGDHSRTIAAAWKEFED